MDILDNTIYLYKEVGYHIGCVQLIDSMGTDARIVDAARVSFNQDQQLEDEQELSDRDKKLIKYLIDHQHTSTLEHCLVTCKFTVPLYVRSQHHRHRTWKFNEISRRYTDENIQFYLPNKFRKQHKSNRQASTLEYIDPILEDNSVIYADEADDKEASIAMREYFESSLFLYSKLLEAGVCREQARGVLSTATYTEYYGTIDLNNLLKFILVRTHEGAQWEIQQVAFALLTFAEQLWPTAVGHFIDKFDHLRIKE